MKKVKIDATEHFRASDHWTSQCVECNKTAVVNITRTHVSEANATPISLCKFCAQTLAAEINSALNTRE